jgi:hypothetical protein
LKIIKKSQKIKLLYGGFNPDAQNFNHHRFLLFKVSLTASFRGSSVRKKIIREKSKIYKNSQNTKKIKKLLNYLQEKCLVMRIG